MPWLTHRVSLISIRIRRCAYPDCASHSLIAVSPQTNGGEQFAEGNGAVESDSEAIRCDDFDRGRWGIDEGNRHEGRWRAGTLFLSMLFEPVMRISIDTKAKIKLGEFSRGGKLRCFEPIKARDHDMEASGMLVPFGILEVKQKQFNVVYGNSLETSDFIVDGLNYWWRYNKRR